MGVEIGQIIDGKYRVVALIGEGGMGAVFAGEHLRLHRKVAIKVLHAAMAADVEVVRRFEREAQAAGKIGNDHILEVLDIGELPGGDRFMVMEFLDGEPLNARLERLRRMPPRQIVPIVRELLEGLSAAHAAGIVHRDLKPANVFIQREKAGRLDYVKIIDFGISKFQNVGGDEAKSRTGMIIGTPLDMSPEQARGLSEADSRTDLYAVGVILFEAVTGRVPFTGASPTDLLFQIALSAPPPIASLVSDVEPAFCSIVEKAMARDPNARFQTGAEFIAALDAWAQKGLGVSAPIPVPTQLLADPRSAMPTGPISPYAATPAPTGGTPWATAHSQPPKARGGGAAIAVISLLVLIVGSVGVVLALRVHKADAPATSAASASQPGSASGALVPPPPTTASEVVTLAPAPSTAAAPSSPPPPTSSPEPSAAGSAQHAPRAVVGPANAPPHHPPPGAAASAPNGAYNPFGHL